MRFTVIYIHINTQVTVTVKVTGVKRASLTGVTGPTVMVTVKPLRKQVQQMVQAINFKFIPGLVKRKEKNLLKIQPLPGLIKFKCYNKLSVIVTVTVTNSAAYASYNIKTNTSSSSTVT
jgi:hypothetical protein